MICASETARIVSRLERAKARLEGGEAAALVPHVSAAIKSHEEPLPMVRTVSELNAVLAGIAPVLPFSEVDRSAQARALAATNCQQGQRKLAMTLLEAIAATLGKLKVEQTDLLVVYAGAPAAAVMSAAAVFSNVRFMLLDADPQAVPTLQEAAAVVGDRTVVEGGAASGARCLVLTGEPMADATAEWLRSVLVPATGRTAVLFVCDVRGRTPEDSMVDQQRWTLAIGASAYLLKFNVPYGAKRDAALQRYREAAVAPLSASPSGAAGMVYLDGDLVIPLYGRARGAEVRLMGFARSASKYRVQSYDSSAVEDALAVFNAVYRAHAGFKQGYSAAFIGDGVPPTYERVGEFAVFSACSRALGAPCKTKADAVAGAQHVQQLIRDAGVPEDEEGLCGLQTAANDVPRLAPGPERDDVTEFLRDCLARVQGRVPPELAAKLQL